MLRLSKCARSLTRRFGFAQTAPARFVCKQAFIRSLTRSFGFSVL